MLGHGDAEVYIDGSYSERYPDKSLDAEGLSSRCSPSPVTSAATAPPKCLLRANSGTCSPPVGPSSTIQLITVACVGDGEA